MAGSKLPDIGTNIFTVMSGLANQHGALNLSQGFPDFQVSEQLIDLINQYMKEGHNQYAPMPGTPQLRNQIAQVAKDSFGRSTDPDQEVTIYAGATGGLFSTFTALIHPGDEVLMFDPVYDSYDPAIRLSGGVPIHLPMEPPDFRIPWDRVESAITNKTRMIVINSPHNPTGAVLSKEDISELIRLVENHNLLVVSDEVYERIIFDGKEHESVLKYPELASRSVALFSFGKTFHATGWKMGYSVASPELTAEIRKIHQFVNFAVNTPIQLAVAEHLKTAENYTYLSGFFQKKRDLFREQLVDTVFEPLPCFGTYFQTVKYTGDSENSDYQMATRFIEEEGIASIPVSAFYTDGKDHKLLRFCFAKGDETLKQAGEILKTIQR